MNNSYSVKKYLSIFNIQTLIIIGISILSSYICLRYQLSIFLDFLIFGIIIIFPLTFSLRSAFRRRERALQYLSLFKASLQSVFYTFQNSKLDKEKKNEFKHIAESISASLLKYLSGKPGDKTSVQETSHSIFIFIQANKENIKSTFAVKVLLFLFRLNESIEFLLATHRHRTPWAPRAIVLFAIYSFTIFYPASLLHDIGFGAQLWYVFTMTASKSLLLISLYNAESLLENPFDRKGTDGIRLDDFKFLSGLTIIEELPEVITEKSAPDQNNDTDIKDE